MMSDLDQGAETDRPEAHMGMTLSSHVLNAWSPQPLPSAENIGSTEEYAWMPMGRHLLNQLALP